MSRVDLEHPCPVCRGDTFTDTSANGLDACIRCGTVSDPMFRGTHGVVANGTEVRLTAQIVRAVPRTAQKRAR